MTRLLAPIILTIAALALFFFFTDPAYQGIKASRIEQEQYDQALTKSQELLKVRDELIARRNTFEPDDVRRVERMLPDNVDNIRLILDIDTIAFRYGLRVADVSVQAPDTSRETRSDLAVGAANDPVGSVDLSFSVSARYTDFQRFLKDLERSVRIVDVKEISFSVGEGDLVEYSVMIKTYWLR